MKTVPLAIALAATVVCLTPPAAADAISDQSRVKPFAVRALGFDNKAFIGGPQEDFLPAVAREDDDPRSDVLRGRTRPRISEQPDDSILLWLEVRKEVGNQQGHDASSPTGATGAGATVPEPTSSDPASPRPGGTAIPSGPVVW